MVSSAMSSSTASPRSTATISIPNLKYSDSWGWIASQSFGTTSWPAATYHVSLNVTRANPYVRITAVKIYRVDANGGPRYQGLAVVGQSTGLSVSLGSAGVKSFAISGAAQTAHTGDKLAVKFYTVSANPYGQRFGYDAGNGALSGVSTGTASTVTPTSTVTPAPVVTPAVAVTPLPSSARISHITVVLMENYAYPDIAGSAKAPFLNSFAKSNALLTNSHAITHPSEPNYLALFSGSTQGMTSDACPVTYNGANLATELQAKGLTFAGYAENLPSNLSACQGTPASVTSGNLYQRKHVPWVDFTNLSPSVSHAYAGPLSSVPAQVTFIVPNICDDMHDCGVASGDAWASRNLPAIENYDNTHNGLLIFTFDEGEYSDSNQVFTVFAGPMVVAGQHSQYVNHYGILRFIEQNFGLPLLGGSASAASISGLTR